MKNTPEIPPFRRTVNYKDHAIRIVLSVIGGHIMAFYNDPQDFLEAVLTASYLRALIAGFIMSYIIINYIYWITIKLDKRYGWLDQTFLRVLWQVSLGMFIPAFLVFLLVYLFLSFYGIDIYKTHYLNQDYKVALLLILIVNLYYFAMYCFLSLHRIRGSQKELQNPPGQTQPTVDTAYKDVIIVGTPTGNVPVNTNEIAYVFRMEGSVFVRLKNMNHINESYPVSYPIKELEAVLDPKNFFRINRQMLISREACKEYRSNKNKTLTIMLDPPIEGITDQNAKSYQKLAVVSEDRVAAFRLWIDR